MSRVMPIDIGRKAKEACSQVNDRGGGCRFGVVLQLRGIFGQKQQMP
jgi:hypothetical protein